MSSSSSSTKALKPMTPCPLCLDSRDEKSQGENFTPQPEWQSSVSKVWDGMKGLKPPLEHPTRLHFEAEDTLSRTIWEISRDHVPKQQLGRICRDVNFRLSSLLLQLQLESGRLHSASQAAAPAGHLAQSVVEPLKASAQPAKWADRQQGNTETQVPACQPAKHEIYGHGQ